jgi:protein-tyrosine phosphatase
MKVLFVCLGNICRSPLAEGIFRAKVAQAGLAGRIEIDSAGTGDWHIGEAPDERAQHCARGRGVEIGGLRARQFRAADFRAFDRILAMDAANLANILRLATSENDRRRVRLMLDYPGGPADTQVPDPYFGGLDGFERVYDLLAAACDHLLTEIRGEL